jgi:hypothetical protein
MGLTMNHSQLVQRLSEASVRKHFDAFADIDWEHPDHQISLDDPRWNLDDSEPLAATDWYQTQTADRRAMIGLHFVVAQMSLGVVFERVLTQGLLNFADTLPIDAPELRYAYHEVIEESQHSLMFAEFVRRSGLAPVQQNFIERWSARRVATLGRRFPELFFLFVLAGETPIDYTQRRALSRGCPLHPLLQRVMRIHVTEEARHLSFAASALRERVPELVWWRMAQLQVRTPIIMKFMTEQMLRPPSMLVNRYGIPRSVVRAAYGSTQHRSTTLEGLEPVRKLCLELGIVTPSTQRLWQALGIWPPHSGNGPTGSEQKNKEPALPACL